MKILIHGRQNGYTVLYPKPTPEVFYSFARDIQSINANNYECYYGKSFYTLAFVDNGTIFTKYIFGDDVQRGQLGEIGISVFIPINKKITGTDIVSLLDELINEYSQNYIINNKIDEPKNGFKWSLFESITNQYAIKLKSNSLLEYRTNIVTGSKDPAHYYYNSENELINIFDKPYQEEYSAYSQILFIHINLKGTSTPINVFNHSGKAINPDFDNEYYYLSNYDHTKGVKIYVDDSPRSNKKGENQIRAKSKIRIQYSKDDNLYEPFEVNGSIFDNPEILNPFISKFDNILKIQYDNIVNLKEKEKIIPFNIYESDNKTITEAQLVFEPYLPKKPIKNKTITFKGEEISKKWEIKAENKEKGLFSEKITIIPLDCNNEIKFILKKRKVITYEFVLKTNSYAYLPGITIEIEGKKVEFIDQNNQQKPSVTFIEDDFNKQFTVKATYNHTEKRYKGKKSFSPNDVNDNCVIIQLNESPKFRIDTGTHGKSNKEFTYYENGQDITVIPDKGFIFIGFSEPRKENIDGNIAGIIKAEYKRTLFNRVKTFSKKPIGIVSSIIFLLIFILVFLLKDEKVVPKLTKQQVENYAIGDSLILKKLKKYQKTWDEQEGDSTTLKIINQAIEKREKIDNHAFEQLEYNDFKSSKYQQEFFNFISKIDSTNLINLKIDLKNVQISNLTLTEIKDTIQKLLHPKYDISEEIDKTSDIDTIIIDDSKVLGNKQLKQKVNQNTNQNLNEERKQIHNNKREEIIKYLQGNQLRKEKLIDYEANIGNDTTIKQSIRICLDFWTLDGLNNKTYWSIKGDIEKDEILMNSKLKQYIDQMCNKEETPNPSYKNLDKIKGLDKI